MRSTATYKWFTTVFRLTCFCTTIRKPSYVLTFPCIKVPLRFSNCMGVFTFILSFSIASACFYSILGMWNTDMKYWGLFKASRHLFNKAWCTLLLGFTWCYKRVADIPKSAKSTIKAAPAKHDETAQGLSLHRSWLTFTASLEFLSTSYNTTPPVVY